MSDNDKGKLKQLSTYLYETDPLCQYVQAKADATGLSVSDIIRLSLAKTRAQELAEYQARQPHGIPVTP